MTLAALALLGNLTGCGRERPQTVPVLGRITYGGGDWPADGMLYFTTAKPAPGFPARPGSAAFGKDGSFSATTFQPNDGLMPGAYRVNIECWELRPSMDAPAGKSYVPIKFQSGMTNGFEVVVPADSSGPIELSFEVPKS